MSSSMESDIMVDEFEKIVGPVPKAPDFLELLIQALAARIKDKLMEEIMETISKNLPTVDADSIEGLEEWFGHAMEEHERHGGRRIDADDIEGLDKAIEDVIKNGSFSVEFNT